MGYRVTGPVAVVRVSGTELYIYEGGTLPDAVDEAVINHLLDVGLITDIPDEEQASTPAPDGGDDPNADQGASDQGEGDSAGAKDDPVLGDLDLAGLRALAADRGVDLQGATKKADIIAALDAAAS